MDCEEAKLKMNALIDNEIDEKDVPGLISHLESCYKCRDEYNDEDPDTRTTDFSLKTILVVEDNAGMRTFIKSILDDKYNIETAVNGKNALSVLDRIMKPKLIIADIMMPEMDGKEFFKQVSENPEFADIPFIFLTARASREEKVESLKAGVIDYIYKPFTVEELEVKIDNIINRENKLRKAYIDKIQDKLLEVIDEKIESEESLRQSRIVKYREFGITSREEDIIDLIIKGHQDKEIGTMLNISTRTVSKHVQNIFDKVNVTNRTELVNSL